MKIILFILASFVVIFLFLFVGGAKEAKNITWGANFSIKQAGELGLDWKETYLALLEDLKTKNLRVAVHWDALEQENQTFSFEDLDWLMDRAKEHGAEVMLTVGMKTPRWPECHIPEWAAELSYQELQKEILEMLEAVVLRYKEHPALAAWQVENEPLFPFGKCPWRDFSFLQKEVELVQSLDSGHDVLVSDAGELSLWFNAARLGDTVAVTLYRKVWFGEFQTHLSFPFPPLFYARKAWLVEKLFGKEVIVGELQAEPWVPGKLKDSSLADQGKTMTFADFQNNIAFAKATGLDTFYLWGAEWWYFMKEVRDNDSFWKEAKSIFDGSKK
ncbi:MAG: hypothetical protein A2672_00420 [Candidatus Wildermuthbacteria bacterium RIFCSPHIGHO2_01_FULL_49_22b]|uniref:Glycoside hydrolase family 42 N-terminal domain-containing protein n=1 Tax=Candidatus Wildermuthbacteria bacterium RIFCSPHIGHO2_01_FULL_49_22b TaxID=1802448 RepID=A0A1G2QVZ0_9BACT|nr:MAG: hypothetical protein A2672_00420 [Candidatus Wildermuthbacteria bacterium RIFCSPHIGHO2_01_FULL_49_22b]